MAVYWPEELIDEEMVEEEEMKLSVDPQLGRTAMDRETGTAREMDNKLTRSRRRPL